MQGRGRMFQPSRLQTNPSRLQQNPGGRTKLLLSSCSCTMLLNPLAMVHSAIWMTKMHKWTSQSLWGDCSLFYRQSLLQCDVQRLSAACSCRFCRDFELTEAFSVSQLKGAFNDANRGGHADERRGEFCCSRSITWLRSSDHQLKFGRMLLFNQKILNRIQLALCMNNSFSLSRNPSRITVVRVPDDLPLVIAEHAFWVCGEQVWWTNLSLVWPFCQFCSKWHSVVSTNQLAIGLELSWFPRFREKSIKEVVGTSASYHK